MTPITPKSGIWLVLCCITAIAEVGSVFELSSGQPELGSTTTTLILALSIPITAILFWVAVQDREIARDGIGDGYLLLTYLGHHSRDTVT